ncbi:hypothetical protein ACHAXS_012019 [Conticribra weissflogii]
MDDTVDNQLFITECDYNTRKIVRETNKRITENNRIVAAKKRVEKLKNLGGKSIAGKSITSSKASYEAVIPAPSKNKSNAPALKSQSSSEEVWKKKDEIVHGVYETIRTLDKTKSLSKGDNRINSIQAKISKTQRASLASSPFAISKQGRQSVFSKQKASQKHVASNPYSSGSISKRCNNTLTEGWKRDNDGKSKPDPYGLWKKYRCDDLVWEAKAKQAERFYEKFEHLPNIEDDDSDKVKDNSKGDISESDSSDSGSEDEVPIHAIHDLVEKHVADENLRSQRRTEKMLMKSTFKPDVAEMWEYLAADRNGNESISDILGTAAVDNEAADSNSKCQIPSVPRHVATKKFFYVNNANNFKAAPENSMPENCVPTNDETKIRWICPYKQPKTEMKLIVNEPLSTPLMKRYTPLTMTITAIQPAPIDDNSLSECICWKYEIYDPSDGVLLQYILPDSEFIRFNESLRPFRSENPESELIEKIVHHQEIEFGRLLGYTAAVLVSISGMNIVCSVYLSKDNKSEDLEILKLKQIDPIMSLRACEVLQIIEQEGNYSILDEEFWLGDENSGNIWNSLIEIICITESIAGENDLTDPVSKSKVLSSEQLHKATLSLRAHDAFVAISSELKKMAKREESRSYFPPDAKQYTHEDLVENPIAPLSMRISGFSPYLKTICPGQVAVGERGIWRLFEPIEEEKAQSSFSVWPSASELRYPPELDITQASSRFFYDDAGQQKGPGISVLSSMAFESPIFSPPSYAIWKGYLVPPIAEHEKLDGTIPDIQIPCTSLIQNPLKSRFDTLLPPPIIVLDPGATVEDWRDAKTDENGKFYHRREDPTFDSDGFRVKTFAHPLNYDYSIPSRVFGISEKAAIPNKPSTVPMITHKQDECCNYPLSRPRTAADYHYIAESDGEGTSNEPYVFTIHMSAYNSIHISRNSASSYREQKKRIIAMKEAEKKRKMIAFKVKAAEERAEARLKDRIAKLELSVINKSSSQLSQNNSKTASCNFSELSYQDDEVCNGSNNASAGSNMDTVITDRTRQEDYEIQDDKKTGEAADSGLDSLATALLENPAFVKAIARKLSIPEDQIAHIDSNFTHEPPLEESDQQSSHEDSFASDHDQEGEEAKTNHLSLIPKIKLNCMKYCDIDNKICFRGDGWKRLPGSETVIGDFSLAKRIVQTAWSGPTARNLNEQREFIVVNSSASIKHTVDSEQFVTKPSTIFISDLTTERLRLMQLKRRQKQTEQSILSTSQQQSLGEILQIPVTSSPPKHKPRKILPEEGETGGDERIEEDDDDYSLRRHSKPIDFVSIALLAVKNHNITDLEQALDVEGVAVETRDQHGNTLFILSCQQGSKKLAKFLLRRGADINARNYSGNTALHYLYEYDHVVLAEYLLRKGADDSILNSQGLTPYEGAHREHLDL